MLTIIAAIQSDVYIPNDNGNEWYIWVGSSER